MTLRRGGPDLSCAAMKRFDRRTRIAAAGVVVAVLLVGACGSSSKPAATSTSTTLGSPASSDTCKALDDFRVSMSTLREKIAGTCDRQDVHAAVDSAQSDLDKLKSDLKSADKPRVDVLQESIDDLKDVVDNMEGLSGIQAVIDAGQKVATVSQDLYDAVREGCSSS